MAEESFQTVGITGDTVIVSSSQPAELNLDNTITCVSIQDNTVGSEPSASNSYDESKVQIRASDLGMTFNKSVSPVPEFTNLTKRYDDIDVDKEFHTRLLDTAEAFKSSVRDNIYSHKLIADNPPEAYINPRLSRRSRYIMRETYEMGFTSPGLKALYDVGNSWYSFSVVYIKQEKWKFLQFI